MMLNLNITMQIQMAIADGDDKTDNKEDKTDEEDDGDAGDDDDDGDNDKGKIMTRSKLLPSGSIVMSSSPRKGSP